MKKIALATSKDFTDLTTEDRLYAGMLLGHGIEARPLVWTDENAIPSDCAAVVIRSCWDYHFQPQRFQTWLDTLETARIRIFNPPQILRWNLDKNYLRKLSKAGVKIPPTVWLRQGETGNLAAILETNGWPKAVVKPTVSATAWRTFTAARENAFERQAEFEALLKEGGAMVQKFVAEIQTSGEWSFVFFDKRFSHAVLKVAADGDFRVQNDFGGSIRIDKPVPAALVRKAQEAVDLIDSPLLYARVDGIETSDGFCLMELELIEPALFLETNNFAASDFAAATADCLRRNGDN